MNCRSALPQNNSSQSRRLLYFLALASTVLWISGCGGSGGATNTRVPLPDLSEEIEPAGERLDLRGRNYFPAQAGDTWSYTRAVSENRTYPPFPPTETATRSVISAAGSDFSVREISAKGNTVLNFRRTGQGIVSIEPLRGIFPDTVSQFVGDILEFPEPFYPIGSTGKSIRQGQWPDDLDADGRPDSYRIEVDRTMVGLETLLLPQDSLSDVAHLRTTIRFELIPSDKSFLPTRAQSTEDTWWAPGIGLVKLESEFLTGINSDGELLTLSSATVAGEQAFPSAVDGTLIKVPLEHRALVYDSARDQYYATVPSNAQSQPDRIAVVNAQTGALSYSPPVAGGNPGAIAVASDSSAVFVGVNGTGEVVKLRLPDWQEVWRVSLPQIEGYFPIDAGKLVASPINPDLVAVAMNRRNVRPRHAGVALIQAGTVLPRRVPDDLGTDLIVFEPGGTYVYGYASVAGYARLREISVLSDGVQESGFFEIATGGLQHLSWSSRGFIFYDTLVRTSDYSVVGKADVGAGMCRQLTGTDRWLCLNHSTFTSNPNNVPRTVAVVDPDTLETVARPVYERGFGVTLFSEIVTGRNGQVGLRVQSASYNPVGSAVWIFSSPLLE